MAVSSANVLSSVLLNVGTSAVYSTKLKVLFFIFTKPHNWKSSKLEKFDYCTHNPLKMATKINKSLYDSRSQVVF